VRRKRREGEEEKDKKKERGYKVDIVAVILLYTDAKKKERGERRKR
jgi:hypothetical protein